MNISNQLFQPLLERLEAECAELMTEAQQNYELDTSEIITFVKKKLRQLETAKVSLAYLSTASEDTFDLRDTLRQHKLELRFARRRLKRLIVSQDRLKRLQEKENNVPTVAA